MNNKVIKEKSVFITGGTSGLGLEVVKQFLTMGYNVVATGRQLLYLPDPDDKFKLYQMDFGNMTQVASVTEKICEEYNFEIVINNAGILSPPDLTRTVDGFEYTFQVNFLAHLLVNEIILRKLNNNQKLKIASVTSPVYRLGETSLVMQTDDKSYSPVKAYASSKLYLTLMCEFLSAVHPGMNLSSFSFNPGTFSSGIYRMQKNWFRGLYQIAAPFMRNAVKVARIFSEMLVDEEVNNGMILDVRKRIRAVPVIDQGRKEAFRKTCYDLIDPFIN